MGSSLVKFPNELDFQGTPTTATATPVEAAAAAAVAAAATAADTPPILSGRTYMPPKERARGRRVAISKLINHKVLVFVLPRARTSPVVAWTAGNARRVGGAERPTT